jgi:NitT/TauT family transport system permease protein
VEVVGSGDGSVGRSLPGDGRERTQEPAASGSASTPRRPPPGAWRELWLFGGHPEPRIELQVGVGAFVVTLLAWMAATGLGLVHPQFLPSPVSVVAAWLGLIENAGYLWDIGISMARVWIAFLASAMVAIPLGVLMSSYRGIGAFCEPLVDFVRYLPVPALVPLTLIWLGIGEGSKVALLWIGTFFQLVLLVADDARRVPKEFIETGRTLGANDRALMSDVLVPAMLPNLVDSLRITLGWCWTYLIVAEIVASSSGIGYELWTARRYGKTPEVFAGILTIGVIGLASDQAIRLLHRRWFRYLR